MTGMDDSDDRMAALERRVAALEAAAKPGSYTVGNMMPILTPLVAGLADALLDPNKPGLLEGRGIDFGERFRP